VRDQHGAWSRTTVHLMPPTMAKRPGAHGCGCRYVVAGSTGAGVLILLGILGWFAYFRRKRVHNPE
ncbi:hypothetical protein KKF84_04325, partial [Myxococcota bacterium]|nr:hypothetical protein [Myxococcota bacterium]